MITKINNFILEASLSQQREEKAKIALLVQTAKEMVELYNKSEEFENLKKIQNIEIETLLDQMEKTSIIASGVLIEVIKPYETMRMSNKEYTEFVESSINMINEDYKKMHDKAIELNTKLSNGSKYLRFFNNSKKLPTGTLTSESMGNILSTIKEWYNIFKKSVLSLLNSFNSNLDMIKQKALSFQQLNTNESVSSNDLNDVAVVLEKAKVLIETAEQEKYFLELAKVKELQVIKMLEEFKAKSVAIDDKIIQLIKIAPKNKVSETDYMNYMTNAEMVGEGVSDMANSLFSLYTKVSQVSGSVRQYADDSNSPDGTFNATFDYVFKTVRLPDAKSESISSFISNIAEKIKRFFSNFRIASKKVDNALNHI